MYIQNDMSIKIYACNHTDLMLGSICWHAENPRWSPVVIYWISTKIQFQLGKWILSYIFSSQIMDLINFLRKYRSPLFKTLVLVIKPYSKVLKIWNSYLHIQVRRTFFHLKLWIWSFFRVQTDLLLSKLFSTLKYLDFKLYSEVFEKILISYLYQHVVSFFHLNS